LPVLALAGALAGAAAPASATLPIYREVAYGPEPAEKATIYAQTKAGSTAVVLIHGGGWRLQKLPTEDGFQSKSLQMHGFTVFDINYTQDSPTERAFPLETNDVMAATRWAIEHAAEYGANPSNFVLLGGSAGGQLAARSAELLDEAAPGTVRAVVSLSGPMNFATLIQLALNGTLKDRPYILSIGQALGCTGALATCSPSYEAEWSPALNIPPAAACPAWLLVSSEVDVVATQQEQEMLADLQAGGCSASNVLVPTGHGFSYWTTVAPQIFAFAGAQ
jgi:acetyl esterase/lipase